MSVMSFIKAAPRGLSITVLIAFALLNGLGIWQMQRLHWKEGLINDMARTQALPPVPVTELIGHAKPDWRSAVLPACPFDASRILYMHSQADGQLGYRALTACPVGNDKLLIDLGFIAQDAQLDLGARLPPVLDLVGRLRPLDKAGMVTPPNNPSGNDWYWRSPAEMGAWLKMPVRSDYFLVADLAASHISADGLQQGQLTPPLVNRHFEYALTWFGLAWALIGVFIGVVVQRMRKA